MNTKNWLALVVLHLVASLHFGFARPRPDSIDEKPTMPSRLVNYMLRYGYLSQPAPGTSAVRDLSTLQSALRRLQRFNHLEVTGELDEATEILLMTKRCGVPDKQTEDDLRKRRRRIRRQNAHQFRGRRSKQFVLHQYSWPTKKLSFEIENTASTLSMRDARPVLLEALVIWQRASGLKFKEDRSGTANIQMSFKRGNHGDGTSFTTEVYAHAFVPKANHPYKGDIHFNDDFKWSKLRSNAPSDEIRLLPVALHEVGHALGLEHFDAFDSIMKPYYDRNQSPVLSAKDIRAIQTLYGKPGVSDRTATNRPTTINTEITKSSMKTTLRPNPTRWKLFDHRTTASGPFTGNRNRVRSRKFNLKHQKSAVKYDNQTAPEEMSGQHQDIRFIKIFDENRVYIEFEIEGSDAVRVFTLSHADGTETTVTLYHSSDSNEWILNVSGDDFNVADIHVGDSITIEHEGETDTVVAFT